MLGAVGAVLLMAVPIKVAVPAFNVVGFDKAIGEAYSEHFVTLLGQAGPLKLITQRDIAQPIGFEAQKQLLGCDEGKPCPSPRPPRGAMLSCSASTPVEGSAGVTCRRAAQIRTLKW